MDKWQTKSTNQISKHYSCLNHENRYPQKEKATVATNATPSSIDVIAFKLDIFRVVKLC